MVKGPHITKPLPRRHGAPVGARVHDFTIPHLLVLSKKPLEEARVAHDEHVGVGRQRIQKLRNSARRASAGRGANQPPSAQSQSRGVRIRATSKRGYFSDIAWASRDPRWQAIAGGRPRLRARATLQ